MLEILIELQPIYVQAYPRQVDYGQTSQENHMKREHTKNGQGCKAMV